MDIHDYLRILGKRWIVVVVCTLLGAGGAAAATLSITPVYQSSIQLFVSTTGPSTIGSVLEGGAFAQQRIASYDQVVNSPLVMDAVVQKLRLNVPGSAIAGSVSASTPSGTVLINVTVDNTSPGLAHDIATAIGDVLGGVLADIERQSDSGSVPVRVTVVKPASLPGTPISPNKKLNLTLGFLVGLLVGVGAAILRDVLDTTVRSAEELSDRHGVPNIGTIAYDPDARRQPLVVRASPASRRAEAYRQLRTNLQFVDVDHQPRCIVVTSSVPEEGKTTTVCNLAITLAQAGVRSVVVEGDLRRPRLGEYLGIEQAVGVTSVLIGQSSLDDALQVWGTEGLHVLPSGPIPPNPSELLGSQGMMQLLQGLQQRFDVVLIDAPPLLPVTDGAVLATLSDGAVLIVRHGRARHEQIAKGIASLGAVGARLLGTVTTMSPTKESYSYGYGYGYETPRRVGRPGAVPLPKQRTGKVAQLRPSEVPKSGASRLVARD